MVHEAAAGYLGPHGVRHTSVDLGNPVLAQGAPHDPGGVTADIAFTAPYVTIEGAIAVSRSSTITTMAVVAPPAAPTNGA